MPYVPVNVILDQNLAVKGTISLPYPPGKNEGSFFGAHNHTLAIDGSFFRAPRDFLITTNSDRVLLTWRGERPIAAGSLLNLMLDEPGSDFFYDAKLGITVVNMVSSPTFLVNLGAPRNGIPDKYVKSTNIGSTAALPLTGDKPSIARNVVIRATQGMSQCTFRVEGEDMYMRTVIEDIPGPASKDVPSEGRKAFASITRITPSGPCEGEVQIGSGNTFGLPCYLPAPGFLLRAMLNGEEIRDGRIMAGESKLPEATTGDRRGTFTLPDNYYLDGKKALHLLLCLPNLGNIGVPDFAG